MVPVPVLMKIRMVPVLVTYRKGPGFGPRSCSSKSSIMILVSDAVLKSEKLKQVLVQLLLTGI